MGLRGTQSCHSWPCHTLARLWSCGAQERKSCAESRPHHGRCQLTGERLSPYPTSQTLSFQTYEQNEWILHLVGKLLAGDSEALSLLALNPFEGRAPPR